MFQVIMIYNWCLCSIQSDCRIKSLYCKTVFLSKDSNFFKATQKTTLQSTVHETFVSKSTSESKRKKLKKELVI